MNFENLNKMWKWERQKAFYLVDVAEDLGMYLGGYGELAVNQTSGYTYLWLEDYPFTLYLPISCELTKKDIIVQYTNFENGEEIEVELDEKNLNDLYKWVKTLEEEEEA